MDRLSDMNLIGGAKITGVPANVEFVFDGGGFLLTANTKRRIQLPFALTIVGWTLLGDISGTAVVNLWKSSYSGYPSSVSDKITASLPPTVTTTTKATSTTLTGWTVSASIDDILVANLDSVTNFTDLTLVLKVLKG